MRTLFNPLWAVLVLTSIGCGGSTEEQPAGASGASSAASGPGTVAASSGAGGEGAGAGGAAGSGGAGGESGEAGSGGQNVTPPPPREAVFNTPQNGAADLAIEAKITELVNLAVPGSTVRVALFHWTRLPMVEPFVAAAARGVDVRIVLDRDNRDQNGEHNAAVKALEAGLPAGSVTLCRDAQNTGACIGTNINHNKFFLFSELADGSKNVVGQSSQNFTTTQTHLWNNLVIIRNDAGLYAGYLKYWGDLKAQTQNANYYTVVDGEGGTRAYFFPRASGDTVEGVLDNVDCPGADLRLAMAIFTTGRTNVANKLVALKQAGCGVEAVLGEGAAAEIISTLKAGGVKVTEFLAPTGESVHSKYLLIEGSYNGQPGRKLVWTGSHNYSDNALRDNDEALLKVDDATVYDAYKANWIAAKSAAAP
jgi:phosphatidylserine/phosphatidylglycerophosphate/cardiolipin synthase-like enzyme